ncbi:hypothetical protein FRC02_011560 [Tulasnella sp. 418]|nr:hypothetical protein FRC02_011560 [Tulasnella sp. 418]
MAVDVSQGSDARGLIKTINNATSTFAVELADNWPFPDEKGEYKGPEKLSIIETALLQCHPTHPRARLLLQIAIQASILGKMDQNLRKYCYWKEDQGE